MSNTLLSRWHALTHSLGLVRPQALGEDILARYNEPHRVYHTSTHLFQVLTLLGELTQDTRLHLAAWFHDAIYHPLRHDNEVRSANLARSALLNSALSEKETEYIARAILATADHVSAEDTFAPLLDADLAILGAPPAIYHQYCHAVRQEYKQVPTFFFKRGRARFLKGLLARPFLYHTTTCQIRYETQARRNIEEELKGF